jgi:hypothetical protein
LLHSAEAARRRGVFATGPGKGFIQREPVVSSWATKIMPATKGFVYLSVFVS